MRPLRFSINVTLDGCYDHTAVVPDADLHEHAAASIAQADALILGRVTYGMMESAWRPPAESGEPADWMDEWMMSFARTIHAAKKYVVSSTLDHVDWNAELVRGDVFEAIRRLKSEPGDGLFVGGVQLAHSLAERDMIDEYDIIVHPVIAGHGPWLFAGLSKPVDLELVDRKQLGSGAMAMRYRPRR